MEKSEQIKSTTIGMISRVGCPERALAVRAGSQMPRRRVCGGRKAPVHHISVEEAVPLSIKRQALGSGTGRTRGAGRQAGGPDGTQRMKGGDSEHPQTLS